MARQTRAFPVKEMTQSRADILVVNNDNVYGAHTIGGLYIFHNLENNYLQDIKKTKHVEWALLNYVKSPPLHFNKNISWFLYKRRINSNTRGSNKATSNSSTNPSLHFVIIRPIQANRKCTTC